MTHRKHLLLASLVVALLAEAGHCQPSWQVQQAKADASHWTAWALGELYGSYDISDAVAMHIKGEAGVGYFAAPRLALCGSLAVDHTAGANTFDTSFFIHRGGTFGLTARYYLFRSAILFVEGGLAADYGHTFAFDEQWRKLLVRPCAGLGLEYLFTVGAPWANRHLGISAKLSTLVPLRNTDAYYTHAFPVVRLFAGLSYHF